MAIDINKSYDDAKRKINSFKKLNEVKTEYDNRIDKFTNNFQKKADNIQINLDTAEKSRQLKEKFTTSFDELIEMIKTSNDSRSQKQIIEILKETLQKLPSLVEQIIQEELLKSSGCSSDETFPTNQEIYIPISKIDIFKQLQFDPDGQLGTTIYEKKPYLSQNDSPPKSTNRFFYQVIQGNGLVFQYNGASGQPLFNISYETFNGVEQGNFFKVTLLDRVNSPNLISAFLVDYYKSLKMLDFQNAVTKIVDFVLNFFTVNAGTGPASLNDQKKFYLILQRILGMCFDYDKEIDVGGISKYPEYDNTTNSLFEFTPSELSQIDNEIDLIRRGVVEFIDCNNITLPVTNTEYISDIIAETNEDGSNVDTIIQEVFFNLSNDRRWELQLPQIFNASFNEDIIKKFISGTVSSILSPKVLFPQFVVAQSLLLSASQFGATANENLTNEFPGAMAFAQNNRTFAINVISRISAVFIEELMNALRADLMKLAENIIFDIAKKRNKYLAVLVENIIKQTKLIVTGGINAISDYRQCKSLLDYIFNLLSVGGILALQKLKKKELIPTPILFLSQTLSGSNPDRELIEYIEQMQSLGLPVGRGINGEPDIATVATYATFQAIFNERAKNGKVEGVAYTETVAPTGQPTGIVRVVGKSI
jgi:hypothetical protein